MKEIKNLKKLMLVHCPILLALCSDIEVATICRILEPELGL